MNHDQTIPLHDVRAFLTRYGHDVAAWSSAAAPLDALYAMLADRRDDEVFWRDLTVLTRRIEDARVRGDAAGSALGATQVDQLLDDLRAEIPVQSTPQRSVRSWTRTLSATALAAFLVLGASMGCEPFDPESAECDAAIEYEVPQGEQTVFCELVEIVEDTAPASWVHDTLLECIPSLAADDREDLLDDFVTASDDELADLLFELATSPDCDDDWSDNENDH